MLNVVVSVLSFVYQCELLFGKTNHIHVALNLIVVSNLLLAVTHGLLLLGFSFCNSPQRLLVFCLGAAQTPPQLAHLT